MGACYEVFRFACSMLETGARSASDNPLIPVDDGDVISGGNFHAEPVAFVADALANVAAETGGMAERRIASMLDGVGIRHRSRAFRLWAIRKITYRWLPVEDNANTIRCPPRFYGNPVKWSTRMNARSLSINVHDSQIDDLMQRLRNTRFPASLDAQQWNDGAALAFVRRLTDYWQSQFDWRAQEARLNELPFLGRTVF